MGITYSVEGLGEVAPLECVAGLSQSVDYSVGLGNPNPAIRTL